MHCIEPWVVSVSSQATVQMATVSCPPMNTHLQYDGVASVELCSPLNCGPSSTRMTHSLTTVTANSSCILPSTRSPAQSCATGATDFSSLSTVLSSGLPVITTNSTQTYRYITATPRVSTYANQAARKGLDRLWTIVLCVIFAPAFLR